MRVGALRLLSGVRMREPLQRGRAAGPCWPILMGGGRHFCRQTIGVVGHRIARRATNLPQRECAAWLCRRAGWLRRAVACPLRQRTQTAPRIALAVQELGNDLTTKDLCPCGWGPRYSRVHRRRRSGALRIPARARVAVKLYAPAHARGPPPAAASSALVWY